MVCLEGIHLKVIHYFFLAFVATLMFFILSLKIIDDSLREYIHPAAIFVFKLFLMFGTIYIADRFIENWRFLNVICK